MKQKTFFYRQYYHHVYIAHSVDYVKMPKVCYLSSNFIMFRINLRPGVLLPFLRLIVANVSQQVRCLDWDYQANLSATGQTVIRTKSQGRVVQSWVEITSRLVRNLNSINESLRVKFSLILLVYIYDYVLLKEQGILSEKMLLSKRKKKPGLKFNPGLALIGLRTTGPW